MSSFKLAKRVNWPGLNRMATHTFVLAFLLLTRQTTAQCPSTVVPPCVCASTRFEPVNIVCDSAQTLSIALAALGSGALAIDSLSITNTPIVALPANAFQRFSIKRLVLNRNDLKLIDPQAFAGRTLLSIEELDLRNNNLGQVPVPGINRLQNLKTLVLAKNKISFVPPRAFDTYQSKAVLKKLDLSGNQLKELEPQALIGLTAIEQISIDKNYLTSVPTAALRQLSTLEDLSLGVNQLLEIPIGALAFPSLKSLSLEVNSISRIAPEVFQGVPNLHYLYLSANRFTEIQPQMFQYIPKLKVLAMGNNPIKRVAANAFQYIPNLVRLELSESLIEFIESGAFQVISKVQVIVLNKNKLQSIVRSTFQGLNELYSLDLKGNEISFVEDRSLAQLPGLRHLDISSNKLAHLEQNTFAGTFQRTHPATSRVLYIYENPWVCDQRLDWFRQWLRENGDMMIDAPGYPPTVCYKPAAFFNWRIRQSVTGSSVDSTIGRGTVQVPSFVPAKNGQITNPNLKPDQPVPFVAQPDDPVYRPKLSGLNLAAVILGIILGILLLSILLLMVVRYFISKNRRQRKHDDDEVRRFDSSLSGYQSGASGSAFPSPPLGCGDQPSSANSTQPRGGGRNGYFLSRPWYWWF